MKNEEAIISDSATLPPSNHQPVDAVDTGDASVSSKQSVRLIALCNGATFFHDRQRQPYVAFQVAKHCEVYPITREGLGEWLQAQFFKKNGTTVTESALTEALGVLAGKAKFQGDQQDVYIRCARVKDRIYVDLGTPDWQAIEIHSTGWQIVNLPPVYFVRPPGFAAMPMPDRNGTIDVLRRHLSLEDENQFVLLCGFILSSFTGNGPYLFLEINGPQGSAKSTTSKMLKRIIDPNAAPVRSLIRNERDLAIAAQKNHLLAFDNANGIGADMSDALCRLSTGGAFTTRKLHTDAAEVVFDAKRPVIINGITKTCTRPDLLERTLVLDLPVITPERRREEAIVWSEFEADLPRIMGAICEALATGLRELPNLPEQDWPRMADAFKFITAAGSAFGWDWNTFKGAFEQNRRDALDRALDGNELVAALEDMLDETGGSWSGTATDLMKKVNPGRRWGLPRAANHLSAELTTLQPVVLQAGISAKKGRDGRGSQKVWIINRIEPSTASTVDRNDQPTNWAGFSAAQVQEE